MPLVAQVVGTAEAPGYMVEDTAAGTRVWRATGPVDVHAVTVPGTACPLVALAAVPLQHPNPDSS